MLELSSEQRNINPYHFIDAGFINYRLCFSTFGAKFVRIFEQNRKPEIDHWAKLYNNHLLVDMILLECRMSGVKTLGEVLFESTDGQLFCSTEELAGNPDVYDKPRIRNQVLVPYENRDIFLEFSTNHFIGDTGKAEQTSQEKVSIVGVVRKFYEKQVILHPLVMGAPSFDHQSNSELQPKVDLMWYGWDWYETYPEDIDEFSQCNNVQVNDVNEWAGYMQNTPEETIKEKLCRLIRELPRKDWGGELADHFAADLHLSGDRITAAFVLKGPAQFREMTLDILGKRSDQIYRLAQTPAKLLVVQHSHQIGEAVRATLRAFAVAPHNPRRYCLIDGQDTYKILKAYALL